MQKRSATGEVRGIRLLLTLAGVLTLLVSGLALVSTPVDAAPPGNDAFLRTWERTDRPVAEQQVTRTWMWGPEAFTATLPEPYAESPGGQRTVQYFDKSRMEITQPGGDASSVWYVTNGLLVVELVSGQMQTGDAAFVPRSPAQINVAGDPDDTAGPTYATFGLLRSAPALADGATIVQTVNRQGQVGADAAKATYAVTAGPLSEATGHRVASVFWSFMTASGVIYSAGGFNEAPLFENPYYATGLPISEAYWATVKVGNQARDVLMQCFERRCLTYTPDNPAAWQVEMGNVGQHYYAWRYQGTPPPPATATATAPVSTSTATATSTPTATATATATATNTAIPTATATNPSGGCHPSYPDHCIPPPPPDLNCGDLPGSWKPITVRHNVPNPDPHRLDQDKNGVGCEGG